MNLLGVCIFIFVLLSIIDYSTTSTGSVDCQRSSWYDEWIDGNGKPKSEKTRERLAKTNKKGGSATWNWPIALDGEYYSCSDDYGNGYCNYICHVHKATGYCASGIDRYCCCNNLYGDDVWEGAHII